MQLGTSAPHVALSVIVSLAGLGCHQERPVETMSVTADRFVADLGSDEPASIAPWFRATTPATLRRRCPDCPPARRVVESLLTSASGQALGAAISAGSAAGANADISALRLGQRRCEGACCTWALGLFDHGAVHLERACFEHDRDGAYLTSLSLVDG